MEQVEPCGLLRADQPGAQRVGARGLGECSTLRYQLDAARLLGPGRELELGLGFGFGLGLGFGWGRGLN